ncbi:MAG: thioesterase family protein [Eubacterium sp.]|jgi:predicted thioesterase|nr:thioesterase family protein [Eubacterium sp.]
MLTVGISNEITKTVTKETTAAVLGSGLLEVYATPAMVALMEETCMRSVQEELEEGCGTVGTGLTIHHISATPVGMKVRCASKLVEVDGRKLVFDVQAFDEAGLIGQGTHERFIIENEKFFQKACKKLEG